LKAPRLKPKSLVEIDEVLGKTRFSGLLAAKPLDDESSAQLLNRGRIPPFELPRSAISMAKFNNEKFALA